MNSLLLLNLVGPNRTSRFLTAVWWSQWSTSQQWGPSWCLRHCCTAAARLPPGCPPGCTRSSLRPPAGRTAQTPPTQCPGPSSPTALGPPANATQAQTMQKAGTTTECKVQNHKFHLLWLAREPLTFSHINRNGTRCDNQTKAERCAFVMSKNLNSIFFSLFLRPKKMKPILEETAVTITYLCRHVQQFRNVKLVFISLNLGSCATRSSSTSLSHHIMSDKMFITLHSLQVNFNRV